MQRMQNFPKKKNPIKMQIKALVVSTLPFISTILSKPISSDPNAHSVDLQLIGKAAFALDGQSTIDISIDAPGAKFNLIKTQNETITFQYEVKSSNAHDQINDLYDIHVVTNWTNDTVTITGKQIQPNATHVYEIIAEFYVPANLAGSSSYSQVGNAFHYRNVAPEIQDDNDWDPTFDLPVHWNHPKNISKSFER